MLIQKRFWGPIQAGEVTVIFRRWRRPQVLAGRVYRTAAGRLSIDDVSIVTANEITDVDAALAGLADRQAVVDELRGEPADPIYRIAFRHLDEPDPRTVLANDAGLTPEDVTAIADRLARLDAASRTGPWTLATLEFIEANPERRAPDLAELAGRETKAFKLDVRKLKNLGLTLSFRIGYRLSPRGEAYLAASRAAPS